MRAFPSSRRRLWLMRLLAMTVVPLLTLGCLELGLRLGGYGYDTAFLRRVRIEGRDVYVPNEKFTYRFFPPGLARSLEPFRLEAVKGTNSFRIFLFGESAANGDPDATYGVGRYLEVLLRERFPGTHFQVVCVAITAIDSNVILPIARECSRHDGDLWILYMGNNEMVGPFGAETSFGVRAPNRWVIRSILALKATRTGQLLDNLLRRFRGSPVPDKWGGMQMFAKNRLGYDDPARLRAYANFQKNLEDILLLANRAGVPVLLSTVAVNLKDCPPFASVHGAGLSEEQLSAWNQAFEKGAVREAAGSLPEAVACYQQAALIDPRYAELQFRLGRCQLALTNDDQARRDFELARDCDALDFRADTRINAAIRSAASRHAGQGVQLLDAAGVLAKHSPAGIPGLELFYEHVHLNFSGNYVLALSFAQQTVNLLPRSVTADDRGSWASSGLCDRRLAVTVWDRQRVWQPILNRVQSPPFTGQFDHNGMARLYEAKSAEIRALMQTQTPEQARQMYEEALRVAPDDYFLHGNYERFLEAGGLLPQAIAQAERCCALVPFLPGGFFYAGKLLVREGRIADATRYFGQALAIQGDYAEALNGRGEILANQHRTAEAIECFQRAIRANPRYVEPYLNLGLLQQSQGNQAAAKASYRRAAGLEPEGPADYFDRAIIASSRYRTDDAIECLRAVVKAKPEFWQAHYQLGIQLAAKGDAEGARNAFLEALRWRPDFVPARLSLGTALAGEGKLDQALAQFRAVLQFDPANESARKHIASVQAALPRGH